MAYFERVGASAFRATGHVGGAWRTDEQHIAPALGLLAHAVELDRDARRDDALVVGRLSYDILGTIPIDVVETSVRVVRPGRTVELVEATLGHAGRDAVLLRAWLMRAGDTGHVHATALPRITPPAGMPVWDASTVWPGGFVASAEVRREQVEPGRAAFWVRTPLPLVHGEEVSRLAGAAGLFDIANGMTVRVDPREVAFPNVDLTAHLFTQPRGDWLGFDTTVSFGPSGLGLTSSVIHDSGGPIGTIAQILTVRP
ncbi:thioesterase family protein [Georgenia yuyongxinii]|uniref:Thioesterase family protein n=1 Tax=Georgenia yuyongxinii TaxID=2589797 RepID=A0A552WN19_9MICO|nr:thioesterase family protein [Georgenia yuyongxinii]TRW44152.1 thioesterase family protein [Georgenia yuyongxinii]